MLNSQISQEHAKAAIEKIRQIKKGQALKTNLGSIILGIIAVTCFIVILTSDNIPMIVIPISMVMYLSALIAVLFVVTPSKKFYSKIAKEETDYIEPLLPSQTEEVISNSQGKKYRVIRIIRSQTTQRRRYTLYEINSNNKTFTLYPNELYLLINPKPQT